MKLKDIKVGDRITDDLRTSGKVVKVMKTRIKIQDQHGILTIDAAHCQFFEKIK